MSKAKDMNLQIIEQLECPICFETSTPPIFNCVNGHSFCGTCKEKLQECGICRVPGKPVSRCLALDYIANMVRVPCCNQAFGCKQKISRGVEFERHVAKCKFKGTAYCVLCVAWRGRTLKSFTEHLIDNHKANIISPISSGVFVITTATLKFGNKNLLDVILQYNGVTNFWLHLTYNPETESFNCVLRLISNALHSHFHYSIVLESETKNGYPGINVTKAVSALKEFVPLASSNFFVLKGTIGYYSGQEICFAITIKKGDLVKEI